MTPRTIEKFFRVLAREYDAAVTIIVTGAAAGSLFGHIRPSQDIDFGLVLGHSARQWERFQEAVSRTVQQTGIQVNFTEDIDRWNSIALLDYRRHTMPYRRFGQLIVRLLAPAHWAIGKLTRYFDLDVDDLVHVLRRTRVPAASTVRLWGKALRESPRSTAVIQFRNQVEHFLKTYGRQVWGPSFDAETALAQFYHAAGLRATSRRSRR